MSKSFFKKYGPHLIGMGLSLIPFLIHFIEYPNSPRRDWDYFNSLALMIRSYLSQGELPLLDPWVCGGVDILANPQNWIYSPLVILYPLLTPYLANLFSILICSCLGYLGMWKLCEKEESRPNRILLAVLFTLSPFFLLHFIEGHIVYRTFYLLPLVFCLARDLRSLKQVWGLCALLSFMFLDGGLYPFYFSLILIFINLNYKKFWLLLRAKENRTNWLLILSAGFALLMAKAIPVLSVHYTRKPEHEITQYSIANIFEALFSIKQSNYVQMEGMKYLGHEYYHYIGFSLLVLIIWGLKQFKTLKWQLAQMALFSWVAFGILGVFNPWTIIKAIPLVNHIHVQSRFLIIVFMLILFFISHIKVPGRWKTVLLITALGEFLYSGVFIHHSGFQQKMDSRQVRATEIGRDQNVYEPFVPKPFVYQSGNLSRSCYEPAKNPILNSLQLFAGQAAEGLRADFEYNKIRIHSSNVIKDRIIFNFAWNGGWDCQNCDAYENSGLIEILPYEGVKEVVLEYNPYHRQFSLLFFLLGLVFLVWSYRKVKHEF